MANAGDNVKAGMGPLQLCGKTLHPNFWISLGYVSDPWLVVLTILKNMKVRLDHHPNYWGK